MLYLKTFGGASFEREGVALGGAAAQRRLLAVAAMVASGGERGVPRDRVLATLWPESEVERGRQALSQTLYHMRRALGVDELFDGGADLRFLPGTVTSDVAEFEKSLAGGDLQGAVAVYSGHFLDGFHVSGAPEFERWTSSQRARLADRCAAALRQLAEVSERSGDYREAVEWRRQLAHHEPLNGRVAADLITVLAASGDRASALQYARVHEALVRDELETEPDAVVMELVERLRVDPEWRPVPRTGAPAVIARESPPGGIVPPAPPEPAVGEAGGQAVAAHLSDSLAPPLRHFRRRVAFYVGAIVLVVLGAWAAASRFAPEPQVPIQRDLVAVAPFRVSGADPSLRYLREGMMDLLVVKLTEVGVARATEPATVLGAWRRAEQETGELSQGEAVGVARRLGAGQLLLGNVVGTPGKVVISASLLSVPDEVVRGQATVEGPPDSVTVLVDRLAAQLLAEQSGERDRLASNTTSSLEALRSYLAAQTAYRRGEYPSAVELFSRAVDRDSGFAMAALGLALAAERVEGSAERTRGIDLAWRSRSELADRDRAVLDALAGPRYPDESSLAEHLAAWEHAAAVAPDRAEVWHELGERLFTDGRAVGAKSPEERAGAAFRRARELDPSFLPPLEWMALIAARAGDRSELRAQANAYLRRAPRGAREPFLRWRVAVAQNNEEQLIRARARFDSLDAAALRWIALVSLHDAVALADGEQALALLRARAARLADRRDAVLGAHAMALLQGEMDSARALAHELDDGQPGSRLAERLIVLDGLYGGAAGAETDSAAARIAGSGTGYEPTLEDACVHGQWSAWRDAGREVRQALRRLRQARSGDGPATACVALVEAITAVVRGYPEAPRLVARTDSMLAVGQALGDLRQYGTLAVARLHDRLDEPGRALASVRRRPYLRGWPRYLAAYLREEGRLAARTGDRDAAARAYRQYLVFRNAAGAEVRPQVDSVRAELGALGWRYAR